MIYYYFYIGAKEHIFTKKNNLYLSYLSDYQLAISQSSRGLGLVACLEGQKINNMPNMASRKFSYIPKVICVA
jgi:hypothetical protein